MQPILPVITVWFLDIPEEDSATSLVLQLYQFLSMFRLLMRLVTKTPGKVLQRHIITVKVVRRGQVDRGSTSSRLTWLAASKSWWQFWRTCEVDMVVMMGAEDRRLRGTGALAGALGWS